jgi:oligopeptide/dipeptide ABC transporter ATP-binding protein
MTTPLVEASDLRLRFPVQRGLWGNPTAFVHAVDGVSFSVGRGETLGLVGETGSGKSTVGRILVRLQKPDSGRVTFEGADLLALEGRALRDRRREFQIVFQDPMASLNPRMRVGDIVAEPLLIHRVGDRAERRRRAEALLARVGLDGATLDKFPHEFSGGQRQRVGIARALALDPKFIVLDEPVSALDVSVQAQVVNLLQDLQEERGLTYLFIAHGLQVVAHVSTRVAVMYLGRIVEEGPTEAIFARPLHPYTKALLEAVPEPDPARSGRPPELKGELVSAVDLPEGCRFAPRCPLAQERCRREDPQLREFGGGHCAACHLV